MEIEAQEEKARKYTPAYFVFVPVIPASDSWLKDKKWFWYDKLKYEEYKAKLKSTKKGK